MKMRNEDKINNKRRKRIYKDCKKNRLIVQDLPRAIIIQNLQPKSLKKNFTL